MSVLPHTELDPVLADVKAKPFRWPAASHDPGFGRGPQAASGSPLHTIQQIQVSTVSGDCHWSESAFSCAGDDEPKLRSIVS